MSTSKRSPAFALPPTATAPILVSRGSDHSFRKLLYDMLTVSTRMQDIRRYLGDRVGITGPQYSLMMAIAEMQGASGVSVGRVADYLHVTGTFITNESAKLVKKKLLEKHVDVQDKRVSLLSVTEKGQRLLISVIPELQQINDMVFAMDSRDQFESLCTILDRLVSNSQRAKALIHAASEDSRLVISDRGLDFRKQIYPYGQEARSQD